MSKHTIPCGRAPGSKLTLGSAWVGITDGFSGRQPARLGRGAPWPFRLQALLGRTQAACAVCCSSFLTPLPCAPLRGSEVAGNGHASPSAGVSPAAMAAVVVALEGLTREVLVRLPRVCAPHPLPSLKCIVACTYL